MTDDKGRRVKSAGPSTPVEILGLSEVPAAGDSFYVAANEKQARQLAESVIAKNRETLISQTPQKVSLDDLFNQIQSGNMKELGIIVKADVQGSVEAVRQSLEKLTNEEVRVRVHPWRRWRSYGKRRASGICIQCDYHRLQRAS